MNHRMLMASTVLLAASANASFTGLAVNESKIGNTWIVDVFATYSSTNDVLLEMWDVNVALDGVPWPAIVDNDLVGGTWAPQFATNPMLDSFVTIGGSPSFANSTNAGPTWGPAGFGQVAIPADASWLNTNPANLQGTSQEVSVSAAAGYVTYDGPATWIMRLVFVSPPGETVLTITASQTNNQGADTVPQDGQGCYMAPTATDIWGLCPGEFTFDLVVDSADLGVLLGNWGCGGIGDIDGSGEVDAADLGAMLGLWGLCPFKE